MGDDWMQLWVNATQMKAADQYTIQKLGVPSLELMEHAAQACVQVLEDEKVDLSNVCVVCGSGNNGGDGFAIARILQNNRYSVETFCVGNPEHYTEETQEQMHRLQECGGKITYGMPQEDSYSVVIDAVFGVGLSRKVEGRYRQVIEQMNRKICGRYPVRTFCHNRLYPGLRFQSGLYSDIPVKKDWSGTVTGQNYGRQGYRAGYRHFYRFYL